MPKGVPLRGFLSNDGGKSWKPVFLNKNEADPIADILLIEGRLVTLFGIVWKGKVGTLADELVSFVHPLLGSNNE